MSAAILDVELSDAIPDVTGLERYTRAFVVMRFHGIPVGHGWIPIDSGRVSPGALNRLASEAGLPAFSRRWVEFQLSGEKPRPLDLPAATIAICTRDRPEDLVRALRAVVEEADDRHTVLVVDNCPSSAACRDLVRQWPMVRYVREDTPGLNAARNRALRVADTDVVAFTDDDAIPERGWLRALLHNFTHPLVLAVTGLTLPLEIETPAQEWFERFTPFGRGYFRHVFDPLHCSPNVAGRVGAGANMALRRSVLDLVGPFDQSLDAGTPTRSGGDHEMFARLLSRGYRIVYEPAAVSRHRHRREWRDLRDTVHGYGVGVYAMWTGQLVRRGDLSVLKQAALWALRLQLPGLFKALLRRPGAAPLDLVIAELTGCLRGPFAWRASQKRTPRPAV